MSPHLFRVLVVDDSRDTREALSSMVQQFVDADITQASNGEECLELVAKSQYDLLLLDLMMPGLDGFAVMRQIKESDYERPGSIAAVSGWADVKGFKTAAIEAGADTIVSKPFALTDIKEIVEAAVSAQVTDSVLDELLGSN